VSQGRRLQYAMAKLEGRLHKAAGDKRCGCATCAYWVAMAARAAGISRTALEAELPAPAKPQRRRHRPAPMRARICDSGTIRIRGTDTDPTAGLAALLARLHDEG
jgi:hypothetical protein